MIALGVYMTGLWQKVPALIRGPVVGMVVLLLGLQPIILLIQMNLEVMTMVPWSVVPGVVYLCMMWWYLGGSGSPASTKQGRRALLRAHPISPSLKGPAWLASAILGVLVSAFVVISYAIRSLELADLGPVRAILDASPFTALGLIALVAGMSGLIEEAAFRGYMQVTLEERYHPAIAIVIVALMFALVHPQPPLFVVIFMVGAAGWGVVARLAGSIVPIVIIHTLVDLAFLTCAYFNQDAITSLLALNVFETGLTPIIAIWMGIWTVATIAFVWAGFRLARAGKSLA
jgi:membrane protease YdiL (CAAX protease family)